MKMLLSRSVAKIKDYDDDADEKTGSRSGSYEATYLSVKIGAGRWLSHFPLYGE